MSETRHARILELPRVVSFARFTHNFQETRAFHGNLLSEMRNARGLEPQCVVLYVFSAKLFKAEVLQRRFENPLTTQKTKIEHFNVGRVF